MKRATSLSLAALLLAALACQIPDLPGLNSTPAPSATPGPPPVQPPDGWVPVYGESVSLFVPPGWAGGNPRAEAAALAGYLRAAGSDYEADAAAVEGLGSSALLWAYDANAPRPGALTSIHVAAFNLPGMDLAAHLELVLSNTPAGQEVHASLAGDINGMDSARVEVAAAPRQNLLYIFHQGSAFYHVTFAAAAEDYPGLLAVFEQSALTFRTGTLPGPNPAPPQTGAGPTAVPTPEPAGLSLFDDFSDPASGWGQLNADYGQYAYLDGGYHFLIYQAGVLLWSVRPESTANLTLEVQARFAADAPSGESGLLGLVCGYRNPDDFTYAAITNTGYYGLFQVTPQGEAFIGMEDWQPSLKLNPGTAPNRLRLDCVQGVIQFWINGELTAAAAAPGILEGQFGLLAGSFNWAAAHAVFDDFSARPWAP
ncbi:MAG: hypothetical protein HYZ26_14305 [Chloroflexi bacterium]|nr:hypothetical protein [Chloroflexota bacterium]